MELPESTGLPRQNEDPVTRRPLSLAWISDELIDETRRVWSPEYNRVLSTEEAVEILMNVRRLAELSTEVERERINA